MPDNDEPSIKGSEQNRVEIRREPWWALPPEAGEDELTLRWGYLIWFSNGEFEFDESMRPSDDEIINRTSCFI